MSRRAAVMVIAVLASACAGAGTKSTKETALPSSGATQFTTATSGMFPVDLLTEELGVTGVDGQGRRIVSTTGEVVDGLAWSPDGRLSYTTFTDEVINGEQRSVGRLYETAAEGGGVPTLIYEAPNNISASWSPDGNWAAIQRWQFRTYETPGLVLIRSDASQTIELGAISAPGAWLPDGSYAYVLDGQLMIGQPGQATAVESRVELARSPLPNPQGTRLLVMTNDGRFVVVDLAGRQTLAASNGDVGIPPTWSPDGTKVLYATGVGVGKTDPRVWVYDTTSGISMLVEAGLQHISGYDWSPDGTQVALTVHDGDAAGLYVIDLASGGQRRIVERTDMSDIAWSRDGAAILVDRNACWSGCEPGPESVLLVSDLANPKVTELSSSFQRLATWLKGQPIAWGGTALDVAMPGGSARELEAHAESVYRYAAASPDGASVAFVRSARRDVYAFEVNVRTGAVQRLQNPSTPWAGSEIHGTAVAPDGATVAEQNDGRVVIKRPGESDQTLTGLAIRPRCNTVDQPIWSPGGSYLAYEGCLNGVWVGDVAQGQWFELVRVAWCFFYSDARAGLQWTSDETLRVVAIPTLC